MEKRLYSAVYAHNEYKETLTHSRQNIHLTEKEVNQLDQLLTSRITLGQSLYHVVVNNKDDIPVCINTLYNYIGNGILTCRNIDLPRRVRYALKANKRHHKVDTNCRIDRTFKDFEQFLIDYPETPVIEMDSVEGVKGGKVLLTLIFKGSNVMLSFLRNQNTSASVIEIFDKLEEQIGLDEFKNLFPVILTDNGTEFSNPTRLETSKSGEQRCKIFYCDPGASYQKGSIEKNHEFIRYFIPKHQSFDNLTQPMVDSMMSNINSYTRKFLGDKNPIDMFNFLHPNSKLLKIPQLRKISPKDVNMSSSLFK